MSYYAFGPGGVCLREVFPRARFLGAQDIQVSSCTSDWRVCRPGDLFVALVDGDGDGHDEVPHAIEQGAAAVLSERPLPWQIPTCVVDDTRLGLGRVCHALAGHPSQQLSVIGITGTYGKTTTGTLVAAVLEAAGRRAGFMSSLGYTDGVESSPISSSTPTAPEFAHWLQRMVAHHCDHAIVELSSQALAERRAAGLSVDIAILTNIRRAHLDLHGSTLNYRSAKARLFQQLKPSGVAIINADDPDSKFLLTELERPVITVGVASPAEVTATPLESHRSEQTFLITAGNDSMPLRTSLVADFQIMDFLAATAAGLVLGIDLPTIVRGLESVSRIPGRLERVECGQAFGVFVDQTPTPEALATVLKSLRPLTPGRLICVFGTAGERDRDSRPQWGRVAERSADVPVITTHDPGHEAPLRIAHDILDGCRNPGKPHLIANRTKAIEWALQIARPGDTVLIAGKAPQGGQLIGDETVPFDDADVARSCLYQPI